MAATVFLDMDRVIRTHRSLIEAYGVWEADSEWASRDCDVPRLRLGLGHFGEHFQVD